MQSTESLNAYESVNFSIYNSKNVPMALTYSSSFASPILKDQSKYRAAITSVSLPVSNVEVFDISPEEEDDYSITMTFPNYMDGSKSLSISANLLSNRRTTTRLGDIYPAYPMYDKDMVLNNINKTFECIMQNFYSTASESITSSDYPLKVYSDTVVASDLSPSTLSVTVEAVHKIVSIKVLIESFSCSNTTPIKIILRRTLASDSSETDLVLFTVDPTTTDDLKNISRTVLLSEAGIQNIQEFVQGSQTTYIFQPSESFYKFITTSAVADFDDAGVYSIEIDSGQESPDCELSASLYVYVQRASYTDGSGTTLIQPIYSPSFTYDKSTKLLSILYEDAYRINNYTFSISKKLSNLLRFDSQLSLDKLDSDYYKFKYINSPSDILTPHEIITEEQQDTSSRYLFQNINQIVIESNLCINNTSFVSNLSQTYASNVLQTFNLDGEEAFENLMYAYDSSFMPARVFDLQNTTPLREISFSVFGIYSNGRKELLQLQEGRLMSIVFSFFKK